jgi:two-component system, NarL family, sensor histidine kinase DesK
MTNVIAGPGHRHLLEAAAVVQTGPAAWREDLTMLFDLELVPEELGRPMAVALAPSLAGRLPSRIAAWSWAGARLTEGRQSDGLIRLAAAGAVTCSIVLPLLELARIAAGSTPSPGHAVQAMVATACYLPLHVRHVWHATRGRRPAGAHWTLLAMAVVIIGALPVIGTSWLTSLHALGVSALIVLRPPWSLLVVAGVLAAPAPLAIGFGDPQWAAFYAISVVWRGAAVFVLVWLVGATRRLQEARLVLAEQAIAHERLRIDGELRRTVGAALEAIVARGEGAIALAAWNPAMVEDELRVLAERSRRALAEARRMIRGYQRRSLRTELDAAAALLAAAGIQTRLVLPGGDLPETVDAGPRAALRAAVARLLHDGAARDCWIVVTRQDGRVQLELRVDGSGQAPTRVAVG